CTPLKSGPCRRQLRPPARPVCGALESRAPRHRNCPLITPTSSMMSRVCEPTAVFNFKGFADRLGVDHCPRKDFVAFVFLVLFGLLFHEVSEHSWGGVGDLVGMLLDFFL